MEFCQDNSDSVDSTTVKMQSIITDEAKAHQTKRECPAAPLLAPRNVWFKFNSSKCFFQRENIIEYTPFFYSEGEESSEDENEESTWDVLQTGEDKFMCDN